MIRKTCRYCQEAAPQQGVAGLLTRGSPLIEPEMYHRVSDRPEVMLTDNIQQPVCHNGCPKERKQ